MVVFFFSTNMGRAVELSLSVKLICKGEKAVDTGFGWFWLALCHRKGKPVNQQEMLRAATETLCFFHQATRASLRIKPIAKFSYISLELVSGVTRSEHLWREWRLSHGSLSPGMLLAYPALQRSLELGTFCPASTAWDSSDIAGFFKALEIPLLISLLSFIVPSRSWAKFVHNTGMDVTGEENG